MEEEEGEGLDRLQNTGRLVEPQLRCEEGDRKGGGEVRMTSCGEDDTPGDGGNDGLPLGKRTRTKVHYQYLLLVSCNHKVHL